MEVSGQLFGFPPPPAKTHTVYRLLEMAVGGFPHVVGLASKMAMIRTQDSRTSARNNIFGRVKEIGTFHMVSRRKTPAGDPRWNARSISSLRFSILLLVRLQNYSH